MSGGAEGSPYQVALIGAGMSAVQAKAFANTYTVIDQFTDPSSGLSATVFDKGGVKYFAIRGTETSFFAGAQDWLTNVAEVGPEGIAISQGVALLNYLQRLLGTEGTPVVQYVYNSHFQTIATTTGTANGWLSGLSAPLSVTGHSLGGHLAMMMSRLAPDLVNGVYTYNAPGFDTSVRTNLFPVTSEGFFDLLRNAPIGPISGPIGTAWDGAIMVHADVLGDVVHGIGTSPGTQRTIFAESADQGAFDAHDKVSLTDALAVYGLLGGLDTSVSLEQLTPILEAASNRPSQSLESVVNAVGELFGAGDPVAADNRDGLYRRIQAIEHSALYRPDTGLSVAPAASLAAAVNLDTPAGLAYRYALVQLNPFAVTGFDYAPRNQNHELDLYDQATGTGLSDEYLADRAQFLA